MATILAVEDDPLMLETVRLALQSSGYTVVTARSAEDAWEIWHDRGLPIELIVTDVSLPSMDGLELARRIRERAPDTRIVVISATDPTDDLIAGRVPEDACFLPKPFMLERLREAIRTSLQGNGKP